MNILCLPAMHYRKQLPMDEMLKMGAFSEGGQLKSRAFVSGTDGQLVVPTSVPPPAASHPQVTAFCIFLSN